MKRKLGTACFVAAAALFGARLLYAQHDLLGLGVLFASVGAVLIGLDQKNRATPR